VLLLEDLGSSFIILRISILALLAALPFSSSNYFWVIGKVVIDDTQFDSKAFMSIEVLFVMIILFYKCIYLVHNHFLSLVKLFNFCLNVVKVFHLLLEGNHLSWKYLD
jgi:hypothetical protein